MADIWLAVVLWWGVGMNISGRKPPIFSADWTGALRNIWPAHVLPLLDRQRPVNWLELGSYEGRSALWTVENMFLNPDSRVICVDVWGYAPESLFDSNTAGIPQIIKLKGRTVDVLPTLMPRSFHGCYVDASHEENQTLAEARLLLPLMLPGAVIVFDDYGLDEGVREYPGVKRAVDRLCSEWAHVAQLTHLEYQAVFQVLPAT